MFNFTSDVPNEGTTFIFVSWACAANNSGGFNSHLTDPKEPEVSATTCRSSIDEFIDQLDEISFSHLSNKAENCLFSMYLQPNPNPSPSWRRIWTNY